MTRLYIELHPGTTQPIAAEIANQDFVMRRAAEVLHPFYIKWKSIGKHPDFMTGRIRFEKAQLCPLFDAPNSSIVLKFPALIVNPQLSGAFADTIPKSLLVSTLCFV
jgi:hypothetical protein